MKQMEAELDKVHQQEKEVKEVELSAAKQRQRLCNQLETDFEKILDDKKMQLKVNALMFILLKW